MQILKSKIWSLILRCFLFTDRRESYLARERIMDARCATVPTSGTSIVPICRFLSSKTPNPWVSFFVSAILSRVTSSRRQQSCLAIGIESPEISSLLLTVSDPKFVQQRSFLTRFRPVVSDSSRGFVQTKPSHRNGQSHISYPPRRRRHHRSRFEELYD